ncbi:F-box protein [Carex littledalei]|uniref:F-box protein n=1 Tax=Carex littledalei TaxID=544730 RepID=A0A833VIH7_9POAL|nr:F-box protein [Carex littledalei]
MIRDDKRVSSSNWPDLSPDLLRVIYRKLYDTFDFINFRAVCKSWLAAAPLSEHPPQLPFILERESFLGSEIKLYSLHTGKTCRIQVPEARNKLFFGQSQGYLVTHKSACSNNNSLTLLNPFTRAEVPFPFHGFTFPRRLHLDVRPPYNDFRRRDFYCLGEGAGAFLGIQRQFHSGTKFWFEVYRLDEELEPPCWVKMSNIGDLIIFLNDDSTGFCLSASDFKGIKGNCIYFLKTMVHDGRSLIGLYELGKHRSEVIGQLESEGTWIVPNVF